MDNLLGKNILIEYSDHNCDFESILPRKGTIKSRYSTENVDDWYLVRLEKSFSYNGRENKEILIRSRWQGETLNNNPSVFVLLIPKPELLSNEVIDVEEFEHVVWANVKLY